MSQDKPNTEETANNPEGLADAKSEEKNQQEAAKEVAAAKDEVEVEPMEEAAKKEGISYAEGLRKVKEGEMVAIPRNGEMYFYNQTQFNHLFMHSKDVLFQSWRRATDQKSAWEQAVDKSRNELGLLEASKGRQFKVWMYMYLDGKAWGLIQVDAFDKMRINKFRNFTIDHLRNSEEGRKLIDQGLKYEDLVIYTMINGCSTQLDATVHPENSEERTMRLSDYNHCGSVWVFKKGDKVPKDLDKSLSDEEEEEEEKAEKITLNLLYDKVVEGAARGTRSGKGLDMMVETVRVKKDAECGLCLTTVSRQSGVAAKKLVLFYKGQQVLSVHRTFEELEAVDGDRFQVTLAQGI